MFRGEVCAKLRQYLYLSVSDNDKEFVKKTGLKFAFGLHGLSKLNFTMEDQAGNLVKLVNVVVQ